MPFYQPVQPDAKQTKYNIMCAYSALDLIAYQMRAGPRGIWGSGDANVTVKCANKVW